MPSFISIHQLFKGAALEFSDQSKRWMPEWLTGHPAMKAVKNSRVFKVFSVFGLNDFRQPIEDPSVITNFVDFLTNQFSHIVKQLIRVPDSPEANQLEQVSYRLLQEIIRPGVWATDKHRLTTQVASDDKLFRIDAGTSIVKAYNVIKARAVRFGITMPDIETTREFKEYSKRGKLTVVFSTNPEDIAAMSSRSEWGSCQTIDTTYGLNACVIGSSLSKFIGICYITSGKQHEDRGEVMLARSLVRFVVDTKTNKPAIFLDKMYPGYYTTYADMMKRSIQAKTSVPVVDHGKLNIAEEFSRYRIPEEKIPGLIEHEKSYIDEPEFFSKKQTQTDEAAPVKNFNAFNLNYNDTLGSLIGNAAASAIQSWIKTSNGQFDEDHEQSRIYAIQFGRQLARHLTRPVRDKILAYYSKRFKPGWEPMKEGPLRKIMSRTLLNKNIENEIRSYVNYYVFGNWTGADKNTFRKTVEKNNMTEMLVEYLINNIAEIVKQLDS